MILLYNIFLLIFLDVQNKKLYYFKLGYKKKIIYFL